MTGTRNRLRPTGDPTCRGGREDRSPAGRRGRWGGIHPAAIGALCVWMVLFPLSASSFALRGLEKGDRVPDMTFVGVSGEGGKLSSFAGEKGLIVIYWATWSSRSPEILAFAEKELRRYEEHGLTFLAVNADHQEMSGADVEIVRTKAAELGLSFPVVLDAGLKGYNDIGIISVPSTLILDRDLAIIDAYPGFPSVARHEIPERLDSFLGIVREKPPEKTQYLLDHKPRNHALQYYSLGKMMFTFARSPSGRLGSVPESAIDRLDEAIRRDPDFFRPYLLKAIIFDMAGDGKRRDAVLEELSRREFQEVYERRVLGFGYLHLGMDNVASDYFRMLTSHIPDDPGVLFGKAVAEARRKETEAAGKTLEALRKNPGAAESLGFDYTAFFTGAGDLVPGAEAELKRALERLLEIEKKSQGVIREDAPVQPGRSPAPSPEGR